MILSRQTAATSPDTSPSAFARLHLGTSSLLKFRRHQDSHHKRTFLGSYHPARKNLTLSSSATAEVSATMSLKADAEPNNNVSVEEEVSLVKVRFFSRTDGVHVRRQREKLVKFASPVKLASRRLFSFSCRFNYTKAGN